LVDGTSQTDDMSKIPGPVANGGPAPHSAQRGQEDGSSQEIRHSAPRKTSHPSPATSKERLGDTDTGSAHIPRNIPGQQDSNGITASVDSVAQNNTSTGDVLRGRITKSMSNGSLQHSPMELPPGDATIQSEQDDVAPMPRNKKLSATKSVARYVKSDMY